MTSLTPEQIAGLAPDASAAKAAESLANPRPWRALGRSAQAIWGECQGSASTPYRAQVDLRAPTFRCSCPSRKLPCKHGLGLLLLFARSPGRFDAAEPPGWVAEWLQRRDQDASPAAPLEPAPSRAAAAREAKVAAGLEELGRWLRDLLRNGLAEAQSQPASFWNDMAARMVDAQAPGVARMIRELGALPASGAGWQSRMLAQLGRMHLLAESFPRLGTLPAAAQADVRVAIGWPQQKDDLAQAPGVRDRWLVLGQRVEEDEHLRTQRTWLWGQRTSRPALVLSFAMFSQPLDRSLPPGIVLDAELAFFTSNVPLRAIVRQRFGAPAALAGIPGAPDFSAATGAYAAALAAHPWIERYPLALAAATPEPRGERWWVRDRDGLLLPLVPQFARGWQLLALSGGRPLALFGEWDGAHMLPFSAWAEGELYLL
ncbi:SWIM zinc finger family protein [Kouleothrix sp.]|uniref:SWIM zinc finger family protein n=1 Tax=Kouleothrix sp. TaxID=2779161 RepID=UPI00391B366E